MTEQYTPENQKMFDKYQGNHHLEINPVFWKDILSVYKEQIVPLPLGLNYSTFRRVNALLKCPPKKCGECCRYSFVALTNYDIERILKATRMKPEELAGHCTKRDDKIGLKPTEKGQCYFLKNNACSIYEHRPDICYTFPVQPEIFNNTEDGKKLEQIYVRIKCQAAVDVVKAVILEALDRNKNLEVLPNLVVVRRD